MARRKSLSLRWIVFISILGITACDVVNLSPTTAHHTPTPTQVPTFTATPPQEKIVVNVYVLHFDPLIDEQPLSQYKSWNQPDALTATFIADVSESSGGTVVYHVARQSIVRTYPTKPNNFVFTNEQYLKCLDDPDSAPHCRPLIDYPRVLNTVYDSDYVSACEAVATEEVDEIWLWGSPWFGFLEYKIIQPASLCDSTTKHFAVMGFSYERGAAEMLHNLAHRAEFTLQRELGRGLWDQFDGQLYRYTQDYACPVAPDAGHPEVDADSTHCGNVHFPPNAYCHYQYDRKLAVQSDCDDWLNYPNLTGQQTTINADTWGGNHRDFLKWWLGHLPRKPDTHNGLYNNWWKYIFFQ